MTKAETILWRSLRGSALDGPKFRRQAPIGRYVADFLCVELDRPPHDDEEQKQHDAIRDKWLRKHRRRILRFSNDIVIGGGNILLDLIRKAIGRGSTKPQEPSSDPR